MYLGSCIYDIGNDLLPRLDSTGKCSELFPEGQACSLPLNPGQYFKLDGLTFTLSDIPYIPIPKWNIHSKLTVLRADGTAVACLGNTLAFTNA